MGWASFSRASPRRCARGDKVELRGFGSFRTRSRGARQGAQSQNRRDGSGSRQTGTLLQGRQGVPGKGDVCGERLDQRRRAPGHEPFAADSRTCPFRYCVRRLRVMRRFPAQRHGWRRAPPPASHSAEAGGLPGRVRPAVPGRGLRGVPGMAIWCPATGPDMRFVR